MVLLSGLFSFVNATEESSTLLCNSALLIARSAQRIHSFLLQTFMVFTPTKKYQKYCTTNFPKLQQVSIFNKELSANN